VLSDLFEDALLELGAAEERSGDRGSALRSFRKAVDLKGRDAVARLRLGRMYLAMGEGKRARAALIEAFHLTPEEGSGGLRLSVSYAGGKSAAPAAGGSEPEPSRPADDPLSVFARNLERIPLDKSAIMEVGAVFLPKPKLVKASPESSSSLRKALSRRAASSEGSPKAVKRQFQVRAATAEERAAQIKGIIDEIDAMLKGAPEGSDTRLGMNLTFTRLSASSSSGRGEAQSTPKVSYEPRQVGNDLGLWVMGTGWMGLVEETLPEAGEAPAHPDQSDWWVTTGLAYAAMGEAQRAADSFGRAAELDGGNVAAWLGLGVASVMNGDEAAAVAALRAALKLDSKCRPAAEGLKWLQRPAVGRPAPVAAKAGP
jgi:tetratricopeptide (TPR) repeat protein